MRSPVRFFFIMSKSTTSSSSTTDGICDDGLPSLRASLRRAPSPRATMQARARSSAGPRGPASWSAASATAYPCDDPSFVPRGLVDRREPLFEVRGKRQVGKFAFAPCALERERHRDEVPVHAFARLLADGVEGVRAHGREVAVAIEALDDEECGLHPSSG